MILGLALLRSPNHIILDFELKKNTNNSTLWYTSSFNDFSTVNSSKTPVSLVKQNSNTTSFESNVYSYMKNVNTSSYYFPLFDNANINFLRKERLYTKLKYSRSPAYDIVSGGFAALLAGFIGFLISEKFGFELVDSGDFYFLFMYIVFLCFSLRPLLITFNSKTTFIEVVSFKPIIKFYLNLFYFIFRKK